MTTCAAHSAHSPTRFICSGASLAPPDMSSKACYRYIIDLLPWPEVHSPPADSSSVNSGASRPMWTERIPLQARTNERAAGCCYAAPPCCTHQLLILLKMQLAAAHVLLRLSTYRRKRSNAGSTLLSASSASCSESLASAIAASSSSHCSSRTAALKRRCMHTIFTSSCIADGSHGTALMRHCH